MQQKKTTPSMAASAPTNKSTNAPQDMPEIPADEVVFTPGNPPSSHTSNINPQLAEAEVGKIFYDSPEVKAARSAEIVANHGRERANILMKGFDLMDNVWEKVIPNSTARGVTGFLLGLVPFAGSATQYVRGQAQEGEALMQAGKTAWHFVKGEITPDDALKMLGKDGGEWLHGKADTILGGLGVVFDAVTFGLGGEVVRAMGTAIREVNGLKIATEAGPTLTRVAANIVESSPRAGKILEASGKFLTKYVTMKPPVAYVMGEVIESAPVLGRMVAPLHTEARKSDRRIASAAVITGAVKGGIGKWKQPKA